jgi:hypothetical protein
MSRTLSAWPWAMSMVMYSGVSPRRPGVDGGVVGLLDAQRDRGEAALGAHVAHELHVVQVEAVHDVEVAVLASQAQMARPTVFMLAGTTGSEAPPPSSTLASHSERLSTRHLRGSSRMLS